ncbi:MAG: hypothetical protein ACFFCZ_23735 [Promethearchaeota archaeon]
MVKRLFGSTGIRGITFGSVISPENVDFTPENVIKFAKIFAEINKSKEFLVGRDPRISSPMFEAAVIVGLTSKGKDVYLTDIIPVPAINYNCKIEQKPGIMITGSHTPQKQNAIKFILPNGAEIDFKTGEKEIEDLFFKENYTPHGNPMECGQVSRRNILPTYFKYLEKHLNPEAKRLKIVVDPGNGCWSGVMNNFLVNQGIQVEAINDFPDGTFPGRGPEPDDQSLTKLAKKVRELNADLGVGYDADGDRAICCNEKGDFIWGDYLLALLAGKIVKKGETIATAVSTAGVIEDVAEEGEFNIHWTSVGAAEVTRVALENGYPLAGEQNGGIIFPMDNPCRDGGRTTIELLNLLAEEDRALSELMGKLPRYYIEKEKIAHDPKLLAERPKIIEAVLEEFKHLNPDTTDGVKIKFNIEANISSLLRFSNTEPIFRVYSNGKEESLVKKEHKECAQKIREILSQF